MPADVTSLLRIEVPVIVQIGIREMLLREVLALRPGAIIELPKDTNEEIDLLVNNKAIGCGRAVKVGENFGIQITNIGTPSETLRTLGAQDQRQPPPPARADNDDAADMQMSAFEPQPIVGSTPTEAA